MTMNIRDNPKFRHNNNRYDDLTKPYKLHHNELYELYTEQGWNTEGVEMYLWHGSDAIEDERFIRASDRHIQIMNSICLKPVITLRWALDLHIISDERHAVLYTTTPTTSMCSTC